MKSSRIAIGHREPDKFKMVSLFAGAGGIDIGFELTGLFDTVVAADWAKYSIDTLQLNKSKAIKVRLSEAAPWLCRNMPCGETDPTTILNKAVILKTDLSNNGATEIRNSYEAPIDLVVGGPPCQAFSVRNRRADRGLLDEQGRGNLVFSFMEIVGSLRPKAFLFENVMGLERSEYGNLPERLIDYAREKLGYNVTLSKVKASDYGLPQDRRRIIIVGTNPELIYTPPPPTHGCSDLFDLYPKLPMVTVRDALMGLPEPGCKTSPANHNAPKHTDEMKARFADIAPGKQDPIRKKIRLHPDRPCPAIFSGSDTGGGLADIHPWENRALTPRECARLQGFPDEWEFSSNRSGEVYKLVANAVPPQLAAAFAIELAKALTTK
jgi:DNA (cytosine-5)-methyltransferase 1